jgi:uncharacterized protein DUF4304
MNDNTKRIRQIVDRGLGPTLRNAGFHRHGADFSRKYGEALHVVNFQLSSWNTKELGKLTLNIGVHFTSVAALLFGRDPMPMNPKESRCLLRARVGLLMPEQRDHWWSVTPDTNGDAMSEELAAVCSSYVLPWLEQFKTLAEMDWRPRQGMIEHRFAAAAASLVLGEKEKAAHCIDAEIARIQHDPIYGDQSKEWKEEQINSTRKWATEHGIFVS